jgi:CrcB protein
MTAELIALAPWVAAGSALGGMLRFLVSGMIASRFGETYPWGTKAVNVSGAAMVGVVAALAVADDWLGAPQGWHLLVIGLLGSYTTVSSFSLQTLALAQDGQLGRAAGNIVLSLALCLGAVAVGLAAGRQLAGTG